MEALAPGALHLNCVNPMAMITWALNARDNRNVRTVGLCHSVQNTVSELAQDLGLPAGEIDFHCLGINHTAFYLRLEHRGEPLAPRLHQLIAEGRATDYNRVRYGNGVQPTRIGRLPVQRAALMRTNINVQELVVEALLEQRRDHIHHAAMLDPHTAAVLDLDQIHALVEELLQAHRAWLPAWLNESVGA